MSKRPTSAAASPDEAFLQFASAHAEAQRKGGYDVPSLTDNSFAWFQWTRVAKQTFEKSVLGKEAAEKGCDDDVEGNELVTAIAEIAKETIEKGVDSRNTMGPKTIAFAQQQRLPPLAEGERDTWKVLRVLEVIMRLLLLGIKDRMVLRYRIKVREITTKGRNAGVIQFRPGKFPNIFVLSDLLFLHTVLEGWDRMTPDARDKCLTAGIALLSQIEGDACRTCLRALTEKQRGDTNSSAGTAEVMAQVRSLAATIPYEFPEETAPMLQAVQPGYGATSSRLIFPDYTAVSRARDAHHVDSADDGNSAGGDDEELSVGEILRRHQQQQRHGRQSEPPRKSMRVTSPQAPVRGATAAALMAVAELPQRGRGSTGAAGHVQCTSRFHDRFADPAKHASSECRFCATCHLMEILFNGCKSDCAWKHWPTERRIKLHLSKFPQARSIALDRFRRMERGEVLGAYAEQL